MLNLTILSTTTTISFSEWILKKCLLAYGDESYVYTYSYIINNQQCASNKQTEEKFETDSNEEQNIYQSTTK